MERPRTSLWTIVLAVVGVVLLVVAGFLTQSKVAAEVEADSNESVTVDCGSALTARGLASAAFLNGDEELRFTDADDFDTLESLSVRDATDVVADAGDICRDAGTERLLLAGVVGVLGLVGIGVAVLRAVRRRTVPSSPT